jgi:hypothetical protein
VNKALTGGTEVKIFRAALVIGLLLAVFGWYVLNFVAYGVNPLGV